MVRIKFHLVEYLRVGQNGGTPRDSVQGGEEGWLKYFTSDRIQNHWCMMIIQSRLTLSQFYFIFVWKFLTDNASPYFLHLFYTVSIRCPSWARPFSRNLWWECGLGVTDNATTPLTPPNQYWFLHHPVHWLPGGCHSPQPAPAAPSGRAALESAGQEQSKRCILGADLSEDAQIPCTDGQLWNVIFTISRVPWGAEFKALFNGILMSHPYISPFLPCVISSLLVIHSSKPQSQETLS